LSDSKWKGQRIGAMYMVLIWLRLRPLLGRLGIREGERGKKRKKECSMHVPAALIAPAGQVHHCG